MAFINPPELCGALFMMDGCTLFCFKILNTIQFLSKAWKSQDIFLNVTLDHKTSHKSHGCICSNSQKYIVWAKIIYFSLMPKIIRILKIMFHEDIL